MASYDPLLGQITSAQPSSYMPQTLRNQGLAPMGDKGNNFDGSERTGVQAGNYDTARTLHVNRTGETITEMVLVYANYGAANSTEASNPYPLNIQASLQENGTVGSQTPGRNQAKFDGQLIGVCDISGGILESDPIPCNIAPGDGFYVYTAPTVALTPQTPSSFVTSEVPTGLVNGSNTIFYTLTPYAPGTTQCYVNGLQVARTETNSVTGEITLTVAPSNGANVQFSYIKAVVGMFQRGICTFGGTSMFGTNNGEGASANALYTGDNSGSVNENAQTAIYSPSIILGRNARGVVPASVCLWGDSIVAGTDDAGYGYNCGGWALRAWGTSYPTGYVPLAGETLMQAVQQANSYSRINLSKWFTTVFSNYGRNDCTQGQTLSQFQTNILAFAYQFMSRGQRFIQGTILPAPTSTDGYLTLLNMTPQSGSIETTRQAINTWLVEAGSGGFVAQALAQVAGLPSAGDCLVVNPCLGIECNSSGTILLNGGYILPSPSGVLASGTSSGSNTTNTLNDTSKSWTVNQWKGYSCYINSGTGAGQLHGIGYNTSNQLGILNAWSTTPDNTSQYQIVASYGLNGVHPLSPGHIAVAAAINTHSPNVII